MNILFISNDLGQIALAERLAAEGHLVKLYDTDSSWFGKIKRPGITFVETWEDQLPWVGKDGLIVFDYSGMGNIQDRLREEGYSVFGGCEMGEKLEDSRQYGQKIFSTVGMSIKETIDFHDINELIEFIKKHPSMWVIKQNGHASKGLNYVGQLDSGEDAISVLKNYKKVLRGKDFHFDIQEKIEGIEIAAGRFFNGTDWIGPTCINIEHKNLFNDDLGPKTHEMGNLMWYEEDDSKKLFQETLAKMKPYLQKIKFKGYFDINCIVNEKGVWPLEATARLGQPTAQIQSAIHISSWGELMKAIADGKPYELKYRKGYAVIAFLGTPPYPYANRSNLNSPKCLEIFFKEKLSQEEMNNVYLEEVSVTQKKGINRYKVCGESGYISHIAGVGETVAEARKKMYDLMSKIVIPKSFYRTDIGLKFMNGDEEKLKKWGLI
jgi:phosphoribosylamine--glycine ligase